MRHPNEGTPGGIHFKWNTASFIPLSNNFDESVEVVECMNPWFFLDEEPLECCIPMPALLISTRFALQEIGLINTRTSAVYDADALQLEIDFCLLVEEIGKYNLYRELLRSHVNYWEVFSEAIKFAPTADSAIYLDKVAEAATAFSKRDILPFPSAKEVHANVSEEAERLQKYKNLDNARVFATRANRYFENVLNPKKNTDLTKLISFLDRVFQRKATIPSGIIDKKSCDIICDELQKVADTITTRVDKVRGDSTNWSSDMYQVLKEVEGWFFTSENQKNNDFLHRYTTEGRGCIAILNVAIDGENKYFLTFSGFNDCESSNVLNKLNIQLPFYRQGINFERICEKLSNVCGFNITYVPYSDKITECIEMYTVEDLKINDGRYIYKPYYSETITLAKVIDHHYFSYLQQQKDKELYTRNYSCCERKILAHLKATGLQVDPPASEWFIKFYPCIQCSHAIDLWRKENKLSKLTFIIPTLDIGKRT